MLRAVHAAVALLRGQQTAIGAAPKWVSQSSAGWEPTKSHVVAPSHYVHERDYV